MRYANLLLMALCLVAQTSVAKEKTRISLALKGLESRDTITLQWGASNKSTRPLIMQRGAEKRITMEVELDEPRLLVLGVKGCQGGYDIVASPGEDISVSGRVKQAMTGKQREAHFRKIRVEGARHQAEYIQAICQYHAHLDSMDTKLYNEYRDVRKLIKRAKDNNDEQAIAQMYQTLHGESYVNHVIENYDERQSYLRQTILAYKDSFMGPLLLLRLAGRLDESYRALYTQMSETARQSTYGREMQEEVFPTTLIRKKAGLVTVADSTDTPHTLNFASNPSGVRYTLVDFWASWCEPCRKEVPNIKRIFEKYGKKGLRIVGISADHKEADWMECLNEEELPWENYLDIERQAIEQFHVQYIPHTFIIDSQGQIIAEKLRGKELSDYLENLFRQ